MEIKKLFTVPFYWFNRILELLKPVGSLIVRAYLFQVFFQSGLTKIESWNSTVALFAYEYQVPYISPEIASISSIIVELGMSTLMLLGLGGRIPVFILFVFNICAAFFYPFLWTEAGTVGWYNHLFWGMLLMLILLYGTGELSLDYLIKRIYFGKKQTDRRGFFKKESVN